MATKLLDQVRETVRTKHLSHRTIDLLEARVPRDPPLHGGPRNVPGDEERRGVRGDEHHRTRCKPKLDQLPAGRRHGGDHLDGVPVHRRADAAIVYVPLTAVRL